jgi:hypothetical protein
MPNRSLCTIPNCGKPSRSRGWCPVHYFHWRKHGDPLGGVQTKWGLTNKFIEKAINHHEDWCLIWPFCRDKNGVARVNVKGKNIPVQQVVCLGAHGPKPTPQHESAHSCGNGHLGCVSGSHLRWATHAENMIDVIAHQSARMGERCHLAKLTDKKVAEIMQMKGICSQKVVAKIFGVSQSTISLIYARKTWYHL